MLAVIARASLTNPEGDELTSGTLYERVQGERSVGYTRFWEIVTKLETMHIVDIRYRSAGGRTRVITLRYEPSQVLDRLP